MMSEKVSFVHITPNAESTIAYCARVSSPHQDSPEYSKLLAYCIKHGHWSVFEMAGMCLEIETSRAIAQQVLRHRSFHFQEFSQRYAEVVDVNIYEARRQDLKNRQNSISDMSDDDRIWFQNVQQDMKDNAIVAYKEALKRGIAKEQARMLLPLSTKTRMYMHGTVRDWIHYIQVRSDASTQKEHRDIAEQAKVIFCNELPVIAKALGWVNTSNDEQHHP
jgi:thymidylate synthase (FAD)